MLSTSVLYSAAEQADPMPLKFMWFANSNFINMSPDSNRIVNSVIPGMDFIVTVDPWWTWTAKYSDIVLPATTYWEPLGHHQPQPVGHVQPALHRSAR